MQDYTEEEKNLINSLNRPINNIDETLVSSIVNKILENKNFEELIHFLNTLNDFAKVPENIVDKLINENNKECKSIFLENEDILYFFSANETNRLKEFLNAYGVNIKLKETYDYYYKLLFKQGFRHFKSIKINDRITEHLFTRYNKLTRIKLKEITGIGVVVSYIDYKNYKLTKNKQLLKAIDYINEYGFNIDRKLNNDNIIKI